MDKPSSSSSKVTVEYYDPSNLFPLIARGLNARLPLRNLHWNSPSRPLRSINFLHVDLVPSYESQNSTISPPSSSSGPGQAIADSNDSRPERINEGLSKSRPGLPRQKTIDSVDHSSLGPVKERRHQIPGLRQTPYLKVYLLRCDDGETYKTSSRKHLREWIKAHTLPAQSTSSVNAQENHDAFEWLIVHVVLPNTPAATQPRSSTGGASSNRTEKVTGGSRFLGKSSSTIFEKISADFNGSSKSAKDRVAQIRLHQSDLPNTAPSQMPAAPTPSYSLDQQDQKNAWDDMISKMKSLILTSFDLRVAQYEEDIRERDSQRNLPGWNFCTFFVLKEGLARGFESVGLVEDALVGYDELALGLEIIVREQASGPVGEQHGATFLDHNEDLLQEARIALSATNAQDSKGEENPSAQPRVSTERAVEQDPERWPLNANRKQYRELILANNISMFDFHSYIFSRQLSLLLRLGNGLSPDAGSTERPRSEPTFAQSMHQIQSDMQSTPLKHRADEPENLFALAEVCRRAMEFITSIARIMRSDLLHALQQDQKEAINEIEGRNIYPGDHNVIVENMVSSWTYAMSQQILEQTATVSMKPLSSSVLDTKPFMTKSAQPSSLDQAMRDRSVRAARMPHPARTSSLPTSLSVADLPPTTGSSISDASSEYADKDPSTSMQSRLMQAGTEELAAYRAELYLLARRILSSLGEKRGWNVEFTDFAVSSSVNGTNLEDVPLDESSLQVLQSSRPSLSPLTIAGVKCTPLSSALRSEDTFYTLYESLTQDALNHFNIAGRSKSAQKCTTDLAVLKSHLGDYATAASYFHQIAPFYAEGSWDLLEISMLMLYADCLKQLGQKDDYVRVILKILAKTAAEPMSISLFDVSISSNRPSTSLATTARASSLSVVDFAADLLSYSSDLDHEISVPMDRYFSDIMVSPYLRHYDDKDGLQLQLFFRCLLEDRIPIRSVRVRISGTVDGQPRETWLENEGPLSIKSNPVRIWVGSNAIIHGLYFVDKIVLQCERISFVHSMQPQSDMIRPPSLLHSSALAASLVGKAPYVYCYPHASALEAKLSLSRYIHLDSRRSIEIDIHSGWNEISTGELRIRSSSAGLRLHIAEAMLVDGSVEIKEQFRSGTMCFERLPAGSSVKFRVPYSFDSELSELSLKVEVSYTTEKGQFVCQSNPSVPITLPLGVNVQDGFKEHALFSKFIISTVTSAPLRMVRSTLQGSEIFKTKPAGSTAGALDVFRSQPASLIYKIDKRKTLAPSAAIGNKSQTSLSLVIDYRCVDEEISTLVEAKFLTAIQGSSYKDFSRLLLPALLDRVKSRSTINELERATLLREIDLGPFEEMLWAQTLIWLRPVTREKVEGWLRSWHKANRVLALTNFIDMPSGLESNRQIVIPVEVPSVSFLHTVRLRIDFTNCESQVPDALAAVGQVIPATLMIKHTRGWDTSNAAGNAPHGEEKPVEFSYEVQANPDSWLIAGRRRGHFHAKENEALTFPLMLLPQRAGYLLYPAVEIRALANGRGTSDSLSSDAEQVSRISREDSSSHIGSVSCETDYRNQADAVVVLPDLKSTTIGLDPGGPGGGAWLVDSEPRLEATKA